jgi:hypothetical protein
MKNESRKSKTRKKFGLKARRFFQPRKIKTATTNPMITQVIFMLALPWRCLTSKRFFDRLDKHKTEMKDPARDKQRSVS